MQEAIKTPTTNICSKCKITCVYVYAQYKIIRWNVLFKAMIKPLKVQIEWHESKW